MMTSSSSGFLSDKFDATVPTSHSKIDVTSFHVILPGCRDKVTNSTSED